MYDDDPTLFVAGAAGAGAGTLAFTGSSTVWLMVVAVCAIVAGMLALRLASWSARRARRAP